MRHWSSQREAIGLEVKFVRVGYVMKNNVKIEKGRLLN